jgi:L-alanine-DL-glutamate epimerase-like enolase superfamily enzyme
MLSILHCEFIEIPVPLGVFDVGMKDIITIQPDGFVEAPTKAGLGYEVDLDLVADATTRELSPT